MESKIDSNFVTMDIETVTILSKITPYLICAYNGKDYITSYANKSFDQKPLFNSFLTQLLNFFNNRKNLVVYAHNLSGFDGILLLKHLLPFGKVEPLIFNGKLISIKLKLNIEGYKGKTIIFKDSYLLLPLPLRELCTAFSVSIPKGYFPFKLTNIFYKGIIPKLEYWSGITIVDYVSFAKNYIGKTWSFRDEAVKYCKLDCKCLHEILVQFNKLIFNEFNININISLTLPALAMRIYKSQFMPQNSIYQLGGSIERDIRESYTGGAVDVYIPHNRGEGFFTRLFKTLYYYDVNSLYPFIMANTLMPVGKPIAFEGDIRRVEPKAFGFFYCKITSPNNLKHPILQRKIRTSEGLRTIAGLGSWIGWISSSEMDNAMKYGYAFDIIRGYQFNLGDIFSKYIERMYNLRMEYPKGDAMNLIAKLLMNSLYGKFGMKIETTQVQVEIYDTSDENEVELFNEMLEINCNTIHDYVKIDNFYVMVRKITGLDLNKDVDADFYHGVDVNIAIASAITGGARVWMSLLKNNPKFNLYYSDTDSAVIDRQLPSFMVGNALGQFKLEHIVNRAVFLAPKVYGLLTDDGKEVIKVKGVSKELLKDIHINDLEDLLLKDSSKEFSQEKWFKKVIEGDITISEVAYNLKITSNKRKAVYVSNVFDNTEPFNYNELIK